MDVLTVVKRGRLVFPLACIAVTVLMAISEASYWQSVGTLSEMGATSSVRNTIQVLAQSILDAETGQRGYLLTGRAEYREPYDRALAKIEASFRLLDKYYERDALPKEVLGKLHKLADTRLSELALTIRLKDEGRGKAGTEIVLSGIGKEQMDALRDLSSQLLEHETRNVATSQNDIFRTLLVSRVGIALLSAVGLLALFMYLRQTTRLEKQQQEQRLLLQAERDRLEIEVAQRTAQLTELAHHLQTAREDERHRLARNLHDDLGSLLTSAKLDAARIRSRLAGSAPDSLELLTHLVGTLNGSIALGRRIIEDLRPSALGNLGLVATLEILTREFAEQTGVQVHCDLHAVRLRPAAELIVYRLVQEAITNITKYARARQVWVSLAERDDQVQVVVRDDGTGFDTSARPTSAYGLVGMRFRVEAEGGTLTLQSTLGGGTQVQAMLPRSVAGVEGVAQSG
jgi:signal transduction histidine kinase